MHLFRNASVRLKLIGTNVFYLALLLCLGGGLAYRLVSDVFLSHIESEIQMASRSVARSMELAGDMAVKSFLRAQAETCLQIVERVYVESIQSGTDMEEAKRKALALFSSLRVGKSGYVFCLDGNGRLVYHPRPELAGTSIVQTDVAQRMLEMGEGYFEYEWRNPGEDAERAKGGYVIRFRPWDWYIGVSGYRDEFSELVTIGDLKGTLEPMALSSGGMAFLIGADGSLLLGSTSQGTAESEMRSVYQLFVKDMLRNKTGRIQYQWKDPGGGRFRQRMIVYQEMPKFNWIVGISGYMDDIYAPVLLLKYWSLGAFLVFLAVVLAVSHVMGMSIVGPLWELMDCFKRGARGEYDVRSTRTSQDEIGMLGRYFNDLMNRLQRHTDFMEKTVEERTHELAHLNGEYLREIGEKNEAENKLRQQLAFLDTLLSTIPSPVFYRGTDGRFLGCNRSYARDVLGTDPEAVRGKTVRDFGTTYIHEMGSSIMLNDASLLRTGGRMQVERVLMCADGQLRDFVIDKAVFHDSAGKPAGIIGVMVDISERRNAERDRELLERAVERASSAIFITEADLGLIRYVNCAFEEDTGFHRDEAVGRLFRDMVSRLYRDGDIAGTILDSVKAQNVWAGRMTGLRKDGGSYEAELSVSAIHDENGKAAWLVGVQNDISERTRMETKLLQAQKLESIGLLAAGIAHEINTPAQFVGDNLRFIKDSTAVLLELVDACSGMACSMPENRVELDSFCSTLKAKLEDDGFDFLRVELPTAIAQSLEGMGRITTIVRAMKEFSHPGRKEKQLANLNNALRNTLTVTRNEWKYVADVELDLDDALPEVYCLLAEINQVFMNILVNASHAIAEQLSREHVKRTDTTGSISVSGDKGRIHLSSCVQNNMAVIRISDTGIGIPQEHLQLIFDPFFTTKEVGKGTGQGLAIARDVVVNKHGGSLDVESEPGKGTTFTISLPVAPF